ncbi:MAG: hypothetical protein ACLTZY_13020 [Alistipes indistinctus]
MRDQNNTLPVFNLTRAVSLMRVRIDQHANGNDQVSFTAPGGQFPDSSLRDQPASRRYGNLRLAEA